MNNRLSIPEIAGLLAEYCGADKKTTERFLKEFVLVVRDAVFEDKIVKIKGIGTFKIIEVQDRESVDVNTGKRILIPGHYKFSFVPDKDLKEEVNKPFSFFETVEISDHIDTASMEHTDEEVLPKEIEVIIEEPEQPAEEEKIEEPEVQEETPTEEIDSTEEVVKDIENDEPEELPETIEVIDPPVSEQPVEEENEDTVETVSEPEEEEMRPGFFIPKVEGREETPEPVQPTTKKSHLVRNLSIAAAFILVIAGSGFFFLNREAINAWNRSSGELDMRVDSIANNLVNELFMEVDSSVIDTETEDESPIVPEGGNISPENTPQSSPVTGNDEILATVKIEPGNRLTLLALEYYGNKVFWVYLYEYNKNIINDPNNVPIGSVIKIPSPELYNINSNSKASLEKAALLQSQILQAL